MLGVGQKIAESHGPDLPFAERFPVSKDYESILECSRIDVAQLGGDEVLQVAQRLFRDGRMDTVPKRIPALTLRLLAGLSPLSRSVFLHDNNVCGIEYKYM